MPAAVAESAVERLAERERGVLDRVVVAGLEVARALDDEVEAGVEGELLEEVVVDAGAGVDAHAARAVERRAAPRSASRRSRAGGGRAARRLARPARGRSRIRASASTSRSSSSRSRIVIRIPSSYARTTRPWRSSASPSARPSSTGTKRKFAADGSGSSPSARSDGGEPLALLDHRRDVGRRGERRDGERRREARHGRRRLPRVQLGGDARARRARSRSARPRARTPSRTCAARSRRRPRSAASAVSPQYSKYASSTTSGRASGSGRSAPVGLFGRQAKVSTGSSSPTSAPASCAAMR